MPRFILSHRHEAGDCDVAFAAWKRFPSPLSGTDAACSCATGGHELFFDVDAADADAALEQLPPWVRARTRAVPVRVVAIPYCC